MTNLRVVFTSLVVFTTLVVFTRMRSLSKLFWCEYYSALCSVVVSVNNVVLHCIVLIVLSMYVVRLPVLGCVDYMLVSCCVG